MPFQLISLFAPHRVDVDWEKTIREQGGDPREIEELVLSELEKEGLI